MKIVPVFLTKESISGVKQICLFETNILDVGAGVLVPEDNNEDKVILNPFYNGKGNLVVKMKIISVPAKRYNVGDQIANLLLFE